MKTNSKQHYNYTLQTTTELINIFKIHFFMNIYFQLQFMFHFLVTMTVSTNQFTFQHIRHKPQHQRLFLLTSTTTFIVCFKPYSSTDVINNIVCPVTPLELNKPASDTLIIGFGMLSDLKLSSPPPTTSPGKLETHNEFNCHLNYVTGYL